MDQVKTVKEGLNDFCDCSGQIVSNAETLVYFSKNASNKEAKQFGEALVYMVASDLGKYLGVLLLYTRVNRSTYSELIEKVNKRLLG